MITVNIGLALIAAVFLVLGRVDGFEPLYCCSIAASVLAGLAVVAGLRQDPAEPAARG